jgi:hypothetical protein
MTLFNDKEVPMNALKAPPTNEEIIRRLMDSRQDWAYTRDGEIVERTSRLHPLSVLCQLDVGVTATNSIGAGQRLGLSPKVALRWHRACTGRFSEDGDRELRNDLDAALRPAAA